MLDLLVTGLIVAGVLALGRRLGRAPPRPMAVPDGPRVRAVPPALAERRDWSSFESPTWLRRGLVREERSEIHDA